MKRILFSFALAALLAVAAYPAPDDGTGTLAGTVTGARGRPVPDASVTLQNADGKNPHATTTNAQGRFFFTQLPHGLYDVRAHQGGLSSQWKHNVNVETGKQAEVTLKLTIQK